MNEEIVRRALAERVAKDGRRQAAAELGFSASFLRAVELGFAPVSDRLARALGYRRVVTWEPISGAEEAA